MTTQRLPKGCPECSWEALGLVRVYLDEYIRQGDEEKWIMAMDELKHAETHATGQYQKKIRRVRKGIKLDQPNTSQAYKTVNKIRGLRQLKSNPRRPTKKFWRRCIKGVEESGAAIDPAKVCGAAWRDMSEARKRKWIACERKGVKCPT